LLKAQVRLYFVDIMDIENNSNDKVRKVYIIYPVFQENLYKILIIFHLQFHWFNHLVSFKNDYVVIKPVF